MWRAVTPLEGEDDGDEANGTFAILNRQQLVALARSMSDARSAVLFCLAWDAARRERLGRGPNAGRFVARLSGPELAALTGHCLRTVRYALSRLRHAGHIVSETPAPGKKALYRVCLGGPQGTGAQPSNPD
jgi:hypothetical protein